MKNILITGGAGYLGSVLCTDLINLGFKVTVIDKLDFKKDSLAHLYSKENFEFIKGDVRNKKLINKLLKNKDYIIPLAALVGAPLCIKKPKETIEVNLKSITFLISKLKRNQKIIFATTNSGYGIGEKNKFCDENSELKPISLYGRTKVDAEKLVLKNKNSISFRLATVFGFSYRMRTDLLVNNLVELAYKKRKLEIFEPHFRRNYIHVKDVSRAFIFAINNFSKMKNNIYNVGLSSANLTKIQLAKKIKKHIKGTKIKILKNKKDPDKRDYFVSNKKIEKMGFKTKYDLERGIKELFNLYKNGYTKLKNNY